MINCRTPLHNHGSMAPVELGIPGDLDFTVVSPFNLLLSKGQLPYMQETFQLM